MLYKSIIWVINIMKKITLKLRNKKRSLVASYCYQKDIIEVPYSPLEVFIEPTNNCNLKCIICPHSWGIKREKGFMSLEAFRKVLGEVSEAGVLKATLNFAGEPLLNKNIFEMIRMAKVGNLYTRIHTNGTIMPEGYAERIMQSGLDELSFSFDDHRKDVYERIRVNASYEKTLANIIKFLKIKKQLRSAKPYTIIQHIQLKDFDYNDCDKNKYREMFKGLLVDKFHKIYTHNWSGACTGSFIEKYEDKPAKIPCDALWFRLAVGWDAKAYACCNEMDGKLYIGDLNHEKLSDIWNGLKMQELRRAMRTNNYDKIEACRNCDVLLRSQALKIGILKSGLAKLLLSLSVR